MCGMCGMWVERLVAARCCWADGRGEETLPRGEEGKGWREDGIGLAGWKVPFFFFYFLFATSFAIKSQESLSSSFFFFFSASNDERK